MQQAIGNEAILELPGVFLADNKRTQCINYRHLIGSLARKPQAFRYSVLRDDMLPIPAYHKIWKSIDQQCITRHARKLMVGILKIASDYGCGEDLSTLCLE